MGAQLVVLFAVVLCFGFCFTPVGSVFLHKPAAAERINAHIVAHTHDDVGWLKTVDEYYMGANNSIQEAGVQYILDSVVLALLANPERKFIYVEIAFFERWWHEQTEQTKNIVRDLVATRRLEFINGGWCMNDEAGTDYEAIIDQMTEGHTFLFNEFGVRPTIGWHIDPFGHASTQASLFAQMGFNGFFFARIDYQDHDLRNKTRELEMIWRGSKSLGKSTEIFTGVLYDGYGPPDGFCFECDDVPPIQDDPRIFNVNVKERADKFVADLKQRRNSMKTNNVLIPFGSDFQYSNANVNFKNMDKLMKYIKEHPEYGVDIFYSTPSIYVEYVHDYAQKNNIVWSVKTDDFFPYADNPHSYWTGYFTSRSALKNYVRTRSAILHSTEKLHVTARGILGDVINTDPYYEKIDKLAQAMGVAQHHDAVAGTEKQHVADDYAERLSIGTNASIDVMSDLVSRLLVASRTNKEVKEKIDVADVGAAVPSFQFCEFLNVSICPALLALGSGQSVPVVAYNPIAWDRTEYFRFPVPNNNVEVVLSNGQPVASQVYQNGDIKSQYTLAFSVPIPAMSFVSFVVQPRSGKNPNYTPVHEVSAMPAAPYVTLENEYLRVQFDTATGRLSSITNKQNNQILQVNQELVWYNASAGNNNLSSQASGAYIFRPNRTATFNLTSGNVASLSFVNGTFVQEVRQMWTSWAYQTVRLYAGARHLEMEHTVGPIDISDNLGKEVVTRYSSNLATDAGWYTDSEGQEMQYRRRNFRPTWKLNVTEPVAGNYYPMNTASYMQDNSKDLRMTLINDRSQGCASINDGQLEVMVQRRLLYDDGRGVGEPLNESAPIRTVHKVIVDRTGNSARQQRVQSLLLNNPALLLFGTGWRGSSSQWFSTFNTNFSPLVQALPYNVHILTLRALPTSINDVLLRLNHIFAVGEDSVYSAPVTLDISQLFKNLRVTNIVEMTLSANQPLSEEKRLQWNTASSSSEFEENEEEEKYERVPLQGTVVTLKPMEIRTFIVRFMQSI